MTGRLLRMAAAQESATCADCGHKLADHQPTMVPGKFWCVADRCRCEIVR